MLRALRSNYSRKDSRLRLEIFRQKFRAARDEFVCSERLTRCGCQRVRVISISLHSNFYMKYEINSETVLV